MSRAGDRFGADDARAIRPDRIRQLHKNSLNSPNLRQRNCPPKDNPGVWDQGENTAMPDTSHQLSWASNEEAPQPEFHRHAAVMPTGTIILTLRGALPVQELHRGDRVCTRAGAVAVKRINACGTDQIAVHLDYDETAYVLDEKYCNQCNQPTD